MWFSINLTWNLSSTLITMMGRRGLPLPQFSVCDLLFTAPLSLPGGNLLMFYFPRSAWGAALLVINLCWRPVRQAYFPRSRTEPKGNHVKEGSWRVHPLSETVVCEPGYLLMWSCLPSVFTPRLLLSLHLRLLIKFVNPSRFSNILIKYVVLHGFLMRNSHQIDWFWLRG